MAIKRLVIGLCAALAVAAPARAELCGTRDMVLRAAEAEGQRLLWSGILTPWLGVVEILAGEDGRWTILIIKTDRVVCLKGTGTDGALETSPEEGAGASAPRADS